MLITCIILLYCPDRITLIGDPGGSTSRPMSPTTSDTGAPGAGITSVPPTRIVQAEVRLQPTFQPASSPDHFTYR
jgi:hypothetical protein